MLSEVCMNFAEWVEDARLARRMTKIECADRAGVSLPVWIEYENKSTVAHKMGRRMEPCANERKIRDDRLRKTYQPDFLRSGVRHKPRKHGSTGRTLRVVPRTFGRRRIQNPVRATA